MDPGRRLQPAGAIYLQMREDDVRRVLQYEATMIGSDGLPHDKHPHPRLWGTSPRVLGHYARDIGLFPRKFVVQETFAAAAFALKVGEVSDVVQTDYGLHLIKVTDRKQGEQSEFNKIKEEVQSICASEMWQAVLAEQRKAAKIEINLP